MVPHPQVPGEPSSRLVSCSSVRHREGKPHSQKVVGLGHELWPVERVTLGTSGGPSQC